MWGHPRDLPERLLHVTSEHPSRPVVAMPISSRINKKSRLALPTGVAIARIQTPIAGPEKWEHEIESKLIVGHDITNRFDVAFNWINETNLDTELPVSGIEIGLVDPVERDIEFVLLCRGRLSTCSRSHAPISRVPLWGGLLQTMQPLWAGPACFSLLMRETIGIATTGRDGCSLVT